MKPTTIDRIQILIGVLLIATALGVLLFGCQPKTSAFANEAPPDPNLAAEPLRLDRTSTALLAPQDAPEDPDTRKRASGPIVFSGTAPATAPKTKPTNTAWYFDKQFCGLTHPLAWNDAPILAIDCTVNYVQGAATPSDKRFPPAPIELRADRIGTLCGFIDKQRKVDHFSCILIFQE